MTKVYSDHPVSVRVRIHRRKKALLHELQALVYKRADVSSLDVLQNIVDALKVGNEAQPVDTLHQQQEI